MSHNRPDLPPLPKNIYGTIMFCCVVVGAYKGITEFGKMTKKEDSTLSKMMELCMGGMMGACFGAGLGLISPFWVPFAPFALLYIKCNDL